MPRARKAISAYNKAFSFPSNSTYREAWATLRRKIWHQHRSDKSRLETYNAHPPNTTAGSRARKRIDLRYAMLEKFLGRQYAVLADPVSQAIFEYKAVQNLGDSSTRPTATTCNARGPSRPASLARAALGRARPDPAAMLAQGRRQTQFRPPTTRHRPLPQLRRNPRRG